MLGWLFGKAGEVKRLCKDAAAIIESTRLGQRSEKQRDIALLTRRTLAEAESIVAVGPEHFDVLLGNLRNAHGEARRAARDSELTAFTLCIIYMRSRQLGGDALTACAAIDDFLADWKHVEDDSFNA